MFGKTGNLTSESQVDDDGTGHITLNEFERHFNDASLAALFEALDLPSTDAWSLFQEGC